MLKWLGNLFEDKHVRTGGTLRTSADQEERGLAELRRIAAATQVDVKVVERNKVGLSVAIRWTANGSREGIDIFRRAVSVSPCFSEVQFGTKG